jgi:hypothetical protein
VKVRLMCLLVRWLWFVRRVSRVVGRVDREIVRLVWERMLFEIVGGLGLGVARLGILFCGVDNL